MVDWKIKELIIENIEDIYNWRKLVGKREKTEDFLLWEYMSCPFGPTKNWIADDDGKIVGQYSLQKQEYFYYGKKVIGSLAFDLATHPDYRYQGIFTKLGFHSLEEAGKQDIAFTLGYPWIKGIAIPGHKKVGWTLLGELKIYECSKVKGIHKNNKYDIEYISEFDNDFKGFSDRFQDDIPIYLNRTKEYLNWRYVDKPYDYTIDKIYDMSGEMVSYIVTKKYQDTLHLIDFLIPENEDLYNYILYTLDCLLMFLMLKKISLCVNDSHPFCKFLRKHGFTSQEKCFIPIVHINNETVDINKMNNIHDYYFTMGDNDIF